jgi:hypothetical protein
MKFNPLNHSGKSPPAVRNGNTALHHVPHTTGTTTFSEQIHVAWLSFRTQNFLSHFVSCIFFVAHFISFASYLLFLPTFDYNPVSTVTRLRTCKSWFHSREGHDFCLPQSVYSLRRNNSHCNNVIFQVFTEEFERFAWSLNEHEHPLILPWTWSIAFISTCLDNGIKFLWKQGVCLERNNMAT